MDIGTTIGPYSVVELLGEGGMGEVYRARDARLERDVAIKILHDEMVDSPTSLARFDREARTLATMNHPNIAMIHSLEEVDGVRFIVLELVEGETLAEIVARGPIPQRRGFEICRQIADALEAAHRLGIVHRDLKPSNVIISTGNRVKLLDFGVAKNFGPASRTIAGSSLTAPGALIGTASYMAPEQVRGEPVDERADIWAFGCVMYEMLTGKTAFSKASFAQTLTSVLEDEPDWESLPATLPPTIRNLQRRCLEKESHHRLQHVGDARIELEAVVAAASGETPAAVVRPDRGVRRRRQMLWVLASLLAITAGALIISVLRPRPAASGPMRRFDITMPTALIADSPPALSSDGELLVFAATTESSGSAVSRLFVRSMVTGETNAINGTDGGSHPFLSPDGAWVAFSARDQLKKVSLRGGEPVTLCEIRAPSAGSWRDDDRIYIRPSSDKSIAWIPASGGALHAIPTPPRAPLGIESPTWLPGSEQILVSVYAGGHEPPLALLAPETGELTMLPLRGSRPRYLPTGHLVYIRGGALIAVPFDLESREIRGDELPVQDAVIHYAFADDGTLVYVPGTISSERELTWVDRDGGATPLELPSQEYGCFKLSPDGQRLAVEVTSANTHIWVYDLDDGRGIRLTQHGNNAAPNWTPDGRHVTFTSDRSGGMHLYKKAADGTGELTPLLEDASIPAWGDWSPDGTQFAYTEVSAGLNIWVLSTEAGTTPVPLVNSSSNEWGPVFSPDGRWIAYASDETGRFEIYVLPFGQDTEGKWRISSDGGEEPTWSANGEEIYYRNGDVWMTVPISTRSGFVAGTPRVQFEGVYETTVGTTYDVDESRGWLVLRSSREQEPITRLGVVLNWFEQLERQARGARSRS